MVRYPLDRTVAVFPHTRQPDPAGVLVGRPERGRFVLLPVEALEVLDDLAAGVTVGEAQARYRERHGETPETEEFLTALEQRGLVGPVPTMERHPGPVVPTVERGHLEWISPRLARRLFGPPALVGGGLLILLAAMAVLRQPSLIPGWRAAYFPKDTARGLLFLMLVGLLTTFVHELGHFLAARARGISCRFGIGNRLWFVVWETDITGVWALPARQRYLPILAGPLIDVLAAAVLVLLFFSEARGWLSLSARTLEYGRALLLVYLFRVLWQGYFFLRTDFYYALANLFGCKSLMQDTRAYLRNLAVRRLGLGRPTDQGDLPPSEARMVRIYAVVWLVGRALAFALLLFVQIPLLFAYLKLFTRTLAGGGAPVDRPGLIAGLFFVTLLLAGLGLWVRELWPSRGETA
jgi:putative peptide zinc metalloprotease protein